MVQLRTQLAGSSVPFTNSACWFLCSLYIQMLSVTTFFRFIPPPHHSSIPRGRISQTRRCPDCAASTPSRAAGTQSCEKLTRSVGLTVWVLSVIHFLLFRAPAFPQGFPQASPKPGLLRLSMARRACIFIFALAIAVCQPSPPRATYQAAKPTSVQLAPPTKPTIRGLRSATKPRSRRSRRTPCSSNSR